MSASGFDYAVGTQIPGTNYRVTELIAFGGMGAVYEVEDMTVGRLYAVKTLHSEFVGDRGAEQMRAEARMLGRLNHANVVDVITAGTTDDRVPYIVMERLRGDALRATLKRQPKLSMRTAIVVALDVLTVLDEAHEIGLVHRDIKPENIFLHRRKRGEFVTKLLDFGVADLVTKANETPNLFYGTIRYASPEQLLCEPISYSSDIYSVAVVLYEALCGRHPFAGAKERRDMVVSHVQVPPPPLEGVDESIANVVLSALAKRPAGRPKDAFTFAAKLRNAARALGVAVESIDASEIEQPRTDGPIIHVRDAENATMFVSLGEVEASPSTHRR